MTKGYTTSETSRHHIGYHFVRCPKYRRNVLVGGVPKRLKILIEAKAKELDSNILSLAIMSDQVQLFIETKPIISPNSLIGQIKGYTSRALPPEFTELRSRLPALWTRTYFVSTHGQVSDTMMQKYIEEQKGL